jgi:Flp pilus assembly protein TadG
MSIRRDQRGQSVVYFVVFATVLVGMVAAVLDVGSWYRAHRHAQATADAAALAGAQGLPDEPSTARQLALDYAGKNGGGLEPSDISITSSKNANDTVQVKVHRNAPGVFAKIFGITSVSINAKAAARAFVPREAKYLAPIAVDKKHPMLNNCVGPCFGPSYPTTIPLGKAGAPGAFYLLNLDNGKGGTGPGILSSWILKGFDGYLPINEYYSDPGAKWNSSQIMSAMQARIGTVLLFPIFDDIKGTGANAQYNVIGWAGYYLTGFTASGSSGSISGYFTRTIWAGLEATSGGDPPSLGARSVILSA